MKSLLYICIGLISFLIFVVAFAPASTVWSSIRENVHKVAPDLNIYRVSGTIWNGESEMQFRQFPASLLTWKLSPAGLIRGIAQVQLNAAGQGHQVEGDASFTSVAVNINALHSLINSDYINEVSEEYGYTFSGDLEFENLSISTDWHWITDAKGTANWSGGQILIITPDGPRYVTLPPLEGELFKQQDQLILNITLEKQILIAITLQKGGWAKVAIKGILFDVADLPLPEGSKPDETILLIEEKIL